MVPRATRGDGHHGSKGAEPVETAGARPARPKIKPSNRPRGKRAPPCVGALGRGGGRWSAVVLALALVLALPGPAAALEQKLTATPGAAFGHFGNSVAIDGDTAVVGAPSGGGETGDAVFVFERTGDSWAQTAILVPSDGAEGDLLGLSVAIDGDTIVAGAPGDDVGANGDQGSVYTFARTGAAFRTETAKLTASDGAANDDLGRSVAIDGDTIVAGVRLDDIGANGDQGSVYTFARTGAAARAQRPPS